VCGETPSITEPRDAPRPAASAEVRRLSAVALRDLLATAAASGVRIPPLIDVREPHEWQAGHLQGALHIPLGELPQRLGEIPRDAAPIFMCRSGGRSMAACQIALRANIAVPSNLEGGLLAWAREVDPTLRVL